MTVKINPNNQIFASTPTVHSVKVVDDKIENAKNSFQKQTESAFWISSALIIEHEKPDINELLVSDNPIIRKLAILRYTKQQKALIPSRLEDNSDFPSFVKLVSEAYRDYQTPSIEKIIKKTAEMISLFFAEYPETTQKSEFLQMFNDLVEVAELKPVLTSAISKNSDQ